MNSIRLRSLPHLLLAFVLTFAGIQQASAQDAAAVKKEGVVPGATAAATPATAAAPAAGGGDAAAIAAGDALFKGNCAQCHAVNEQVVGPALAGITKRRPISWILPWVKNSSKVVASGDEYAVAIFNKFNKQQMPSFALSDKEVTSIVAYITSEEGKGGGGVTAQNAPAADGKDGAAASGGAEAGAGKYVDILLIVLVVVLIVLVVTLVIIGNLMKDVLRGRKDLDGRDIEILEQRFDWGKF
jgi:mono/diheme cytochrome c family protein